MFNKSHTFLSLNVKPKRVDPVVCAGPCLCVPSDGLCRQTGPLPGLPTPQGASGFQRRVREKGSMDRAVDQLL